MDGNKNTHILVQWKDTNISRNPRENGWVKMSSNTFLGMDLFAS